MALRKQLPELSTTFSPPIYGVNLRSAEHDLQTGEAALMENFIYDGGITMRLGSDRLTPDVSTVDSAFQRVRGGHKAYYSNGVSRRLAAWSTKIALVDDSGVRTELTGSQTYDKDTFFFTWKVQDKTYISNGVDTIKTYDGATFATLTGTNVPIAQGPIVPIADRLLAIVDEGIVRSAPRSDSVWCTGTSAMTFRPLQSGRFTTMVSHTIKGVDQLYSGVIAFQQNAHYLITGTDFGTATDVAAGLITGSDNSRIQLLDPNVGTSSPYGVCSVPGIGLFFATSDLNIFWIPEGSLSGRYIGDKLQSTRATEGLESMSRAAINQVQLTYFDRRLYVNYPSSGSTFCNRQFWLDLRGLTNLSNVGQFPPPVWFGPMTGQSVSRTWAETQGGDFGMYGGEGDPALGAFIYRLNTPDKSSDARGLDDIGIGGEYQTPFIDGGMPGREKRLREIKFDLLQFSGAATCDIYDLDGLIATDIAINPVD